MIRAYIRIWNKRQNEEEIKTRLAAFGAEKFFVDHVDNTSARLPARERMLKTTREGDVMLVDSLFEVARNERELLYVVGAFQRHGATLVINEAEIPKDVVSLLLRWRKDRHNAQTAKARRKNRKGASPPSGPRDKEKAFRAYTLYKESNMSVKKIAKEIGCSIPSLYRWIEWVKEENSKLEKQH